MTGKLSLALGFAAGYVLGSKAGRERYEQLVAAGRELWSNPTVQSTAGVLQAQANDLVAKAKHTVRQDKDTRPTGTGTADMYESTAAGTYGSNRPGANGVTP
jgi:hypothetical protein